MISGQEQVPSAKEAGSSYSWVELTGQREVEGSRRMGHALRNAAALTEVTAVVPIRKGSQRVPGKNLKPFARGKDGQERNLLTWKLEQLMSVLPSDQVLVSSDWDLALDIAVEYGCRPHVRDPQHATADAPFHEVIAAVADVVETKHMVWTPATSPFLGSKSFGRLLTRYLSLAPNRQAHGAMGVQWVRNYCLFDGLPLNFKIGAGHVRTQDILPIGCIGWAFSARPTRQVLGDSYMFSHQPELLEVSALEGFDINDELDFAMAQHLVPMYQQLEDA